MKEPTYIRGTIEEIGADGAVIKLAGGRKGFVSDKDYFFEEYMKRAGLDAGDDVMVTERGTGPAGAVLLGLRPLDINGRNRVGIDVQWVTSLDEVRRQCPKEVMAVEQHRLFIEPHDEECSGWMWVALLDAEEVSCEDYEDTEHDEEDEAELHELYRRLCRNFEKKTGLGLSLEILSPQHCDRIATLPLAGTEGSFACNGRCCVFVLDGMEEVTKAGIKFYKKSECRAWSQY